MTNLISMSGAVEACQGVASVARCSWSALVAKESAADSIDRGDLMLSKTELAVLRCLVMNEPRWLTSGSIIATALGTAHSKDTSLVRVHVHSIRRKLGALGKHVQSQRGLGYRFLSSV